MSKNLIIIIAVLGLVGGAWFHGNQHGKDTMEAQYTEAENELRQELDRLRRESVKIQREKESEIVRLRRDADERLAELEAENEQLREYMDTHIPTDALDFAFGVRD